VLLLIIAAVNGKISTAELPLAQAAEAGDLVCYPTGCLAKGADINAKDQWESAFNAPADR